MASERERVIEQLKSLGYAGTLDAFEAIADFILEREKRIVEPLVEYTKGNILLSARMSGKTTLQKAINETLKRAGVE